MAVTTKNLFLPSGQDTLKSVERQRQMAAALQGQAMQPLRGQMAGRTYVGASGLEGAGKLAQMLAGTYVQGQADDREAQIKDDQRKAFMTDMNAYQDAIKGTPGVAGSPEVHATREQGDPYEIFTGGTATHKPATEYQAAIEEQAAIPGMDRGQAALKHLMNSNSPMAKKIGASVFEKSLEAPEPLSALGKLKADQSRTTPGTSAYEDYEDRIAKESYMKPADVINVNNVQESAFDEGMGKAAADLYKDYVLGGKSAIAATNLKRINMTISDLQSDSSLTGYIIGNTPDVLLKAINPKAFAAKQRIELVIQGDMKENLGAQFAEGEGVRVLERAVDWSLPVDINLKRMQLLRGQTQAMHDQKMQAVAHIHKYGSLKGYEGKVYTIADFTDEALGWDKLGDKDDTKQARKNSTSINPDVLERMNKGDYK